VLQPSVVYHAPRTTVVASTLNAEVVFRRLAREMTIFKMRDDGIIIKQAHDFVNMFRQVFNVALERLFQARLCRHVHMYNPTEGGTS
jgi:hypothetical protein